LGFIWDGYKWGCGKGMGGRIFWKSGVFGAWGARGFRGRVVGWRESGGCLTLSSALPRRLHNRCGGVEGGRKEDDEGTEGRERGGRARGGGLEEDGHWSVFITIDIYLIVIP